MKSLRAVIGILVLAACALAQTAPVSSNSSAVHNQAKGQPAVGITPAGVTTSPASVSLAAWCGDYTGGTCPGFLSEAHAIQAIVASYGCTTPNNASCNILDDLSGPQYWFEQPLPGNFTGRMDIKANGPQHLVLVDGMSTVNLPTDTQIHGMGGTSSDQIGENTEIAMCNPLTDLCPQGGFQIQNTSATSIGLSVTGSVMTVTLTTGTPFTTSSTAVNQLVAKRKVCIAGASTAADNGCFFVNAVTQTTSPQIFTLNVDSANQVTCASPCGSAVAYLGTPLISFGTGNGGGEFHTRMGDLVLDCHIMIGGGGFVNAQGEEGTGTDGVLQLYNCPADGFVLEQSGIYGGNGTIGTTNGGTYANIALNFNPFLVTKVGGANCSNSGIGACAAGNVPVGSPITCGAGTANFAILTPNPCVNPNWTGAQITGTNGNQGTGEIQRLTISCQDKTATAACIFSPLGASQPTGIVVAGQHISFGDTHTEFVQNAADFCGDSAINASLQETYGSVLTSGILWHGGFVGFNAAGGGIGVDIGQSGAGATCNDIIIEGVNLGAGSGTILKDNITGHTITGSATEQVETYILGHGVPQGWFSTSPAVGIGSASYTVLGSTSGSCPLTATATGGTLNICSAGAQVTSAGASTWGGGFTFSGASGAATTFSTSTTNASINLVPNGTGQVNVPAGTTTVPGLGITGFLTTGLSAASNILYLLSNGVAVAQVTGGIELGDAASFKISQTGAMNGAVGVAFSALGTGTTEAWQASGTSTNLIFLGTGTGTNPGNGCKPIAAANMTVSGTPVTFCSWTLPNAAQNWSFQCKGTYTTTTATDTLSIGVNPSVTPAASSRAEAVIGSSNAGASTNGGAAFAASGATNIFTGGSVSNVTDVPFEVWGTIQAPAGGGTFALTGALTGTAPSGSINVPTTCLFY